MFGFISFKIQWWLTERSLRDTERSLRDKDSILPIPPRPVGGPPPPTPQTKHRPPLSPVWFTAVKEGDGWVVCAHYNGATKYISVYDYNKPGVTMFVWDSPREGGTQTVVDANRKIQFLKETFTERHLLSMFK